MKTQLLKSISSLLFLAFATSTPVAQIAEKPNGSGTESDPYERANQRLDKAYPEILNNFTSQYFTGRKNQNGFFKKIWTCMWYKKSKANV